MVPCDLFNTSSTGAAHQTHWPAMLESAEAAVSLLNTGYRPE